MMNSSFAMLVLGGCRSGKSRFAEEWVSGRYARKTFIATLERSADPEMARRIDLHRATRATDWRTVEEPVALLRVLIEQQGQADIVLIDCLTLWLSNLLLRDWADAAIETAVRELRQAVPELAAPVVMVANEVGLGLVPESPLGRRFRDLAGWTNQQLAAAASHVVLVTAGIAQPLKGILP